MTTLRAPRFASPRLAVVQLAGGNLLLGTLGVFVVESGQDVATVVFWRCVFGAAALALYGGAAGWRRLWALPAAAIGLAVLGGVMMVGNWLLFTAALGRAGIAVATVVFHIQPFLVVLLGALLLGERPGPGRLAWVALGFAGLLAAVGGGAGADAAAYRSGIACAAGGALLYAGVTILAKRAGDVPAPALALVQCLVGIPLLALLGPATPAEAGTAAFLWLAGIGVVHTGLVYALVYGALPVLATPTIAALTFLYPASAVLVDAAVYGRVPDPGQAAGLALIVLAGAGSALGWGWPVLGRRRP